MDTKTEYSNIPKSIEDKINTDLHNIKNHPLCIIKKLVQNCFPNFEIYDNMSPFVSIDDNFDKLLIPKDHPSRRKTDTYYVNEDTVLRTHTSAHQNDFFKRGSEHFLVTGPVFRKDTVDKYHYPVFHQMEFVSKVPDNEDPIIYLKTVLTDITRTLFPDCDMRINDDYFPFTDPSFEVEVMYNGKWLEILGSGIVHKNILINHNITKSSYIAGGLGLERLAMILFKIPDIRYFWSDHPKFLDQFRDGDIVPFTPYSTLDTQYNDISFWIPKEDIIDNNIWAKENNFFELVREVCGDWVEEIELKDTFFHPKKCMLSHMYRITYSPYDCSLNNPSEFTTIINDLQDKLINSCSCLNLVVR